MSSAMSSTVKVPSLKPASARMRDGGCNPSLSFRQRGETTWRMGGGPGERRAELHVSLKEGCGGVGSLTDEKEFLRKNLRRTVERREGLPAAGPEVGLGRS